MIPILASSYPYTGNGLGGLSDAIECVVTHEINGIYELKMRYPITGEHFSEILPNYFVMAKPDNYTSAQPFRIYRITKPLNGVVSVYARHIAYDMAGIVVEPFMALSLANVMTTIPTKCEPSCPFTLATTKTVASPFMIASPRPLWKLLGGQAGSLLDKYGGEWDFDGLTATLKNELGQNRGVEIRYGKNMTKLEQDATLESTYSGVYPFFWDEGNMTLVTLPEKYVSIPGASVTNRLLCLDLSSDFDVTPDESDLRNKANEFITKNSAGSQKFSWKVSFVSLAQAGEYEQQALLEQVGLGDTLKIFYEALGVTATSRVVKTDYSVLSDRYKEVTIGRVKQNLASIIAGQNEEIEQTKTDLTQSVDVLEQAQKDATYSITHGGGVFRIIYDSSNNVTEIVSLDDPDISSATNVWRWTGGGFGFSPNGYNGPYTLALLPTGEIVADFITAGTLTADIIKAGILEDLLGKNSWDLTTGAFTITDGSIDIETSTSSEDKIVLQNNQGSNEYKSRMNPTTFEALFSDGSTSNNAYLSATGMTATAYSDDNFTTREHQTSVESDRVSVGDANSGLVMDSGSVTVYDRTNWVGNPDERMRLSKTGLSFGDGNGNETQAYPATPTSSTLSLLVGAGAGSIDGGFKKWGYFVFINFTFTASMTILNDSYIATMGANVPPRDIALTCTDTDVSQSPSHMGNIPCVLDTAGKIWMQKMTSGHKYAISGFFAI